jgi:hypothetical protein
MVIAEFKFGDLPDEWEVVWPLVLADKLPKEAWEFLDESTSDLTCTWIRDYNNYGFIVRITAKFTNKHDEMIYKLKYTC